MRFFQQHPRGVTLVQTLIIVGIIAVLSSVILANMGEARKKARDKERVSDLQQIQLALRMYKDLNGVYPNDAYDDNSGERSYDNGVVVGSDYASINDKLNPYLPVIPSDVMMDEPLALFINGIVTPAVASGPSDGKGLWDSVYGYVYDSDHDDCTVVGVGDNKKILYALSMELPGSSNWATICGGPLPSGAENGHNTYVIILK